MIKIQDFIIYIMWIVVFLNKPSENQGKFNAKGCQNNNEFTNYIIVFSGSTGDPEFRLSVRKALQRCVKLRVC